jgi:hypothetical protein
MPRLTTMVAVRSAMSNVAPWTCHWPTKLRLAVAVVEVAVEVVLGLEVFPGAELAEALAEVVVELEVGLVLGVFFEQPAKPAATITAPKQSSRQQTLRPTIRSLCRAGRVLAPNQRTGNEDRTDRAPLRRPR